MKNLVELKTTPLTAAAFAPFGEVIQTEGAQHFGMNADTIERYYDLAKLDAGDDGQGRVVISIAECNSVSTLPHTLNLVERHPLASQAFIPLDEHPLILVVAPAGETVSANDLRAFVSNGRQGINYGRGVWHMPLIALHGTQRWLIIDRAGPGNNCEERYFEDQRISVSQ